MGQLITGIFKLKQKANIEREKLCFIENNFDFPLSSKKLKNI